MVLFGFGAEDHFVVRSKAVFFIDGTTEFRGVQRDDADVSGEAFLDARVEELGGEAAAAGFGCGVEIEQVVRGQGWRGP